MTSIDQKRFRQGKVLAARLEELVPGGGHTYSKGRDQFPELSPGLIRCGFGARLEDVDGNVFLDYGMGLRSVVLGHAFEPVLAAVHEQLTKGANYTRPGLIELDLAEKVTSLIPCAEMVKFAKNGSDVTTAAVRLARAYTGRKRIAVCESDPFYAVHDWFIGRTPCNNGVPPEIAELTLTFRYNDIESVEKLIDRYPDDIACIMLEPLSDRHLPKTDFLEKLRALTEKHGIVLIFDEIITGFRYNLRGAQTLLGITPDMATFAKGCANGFSVSMLCGKREIMRLGGLQHEEPRVFLLSATHGAETHALAAALATITYMEENPVIDHLWIYGRRLMEGFNQIAEKHGLDDHFILRGPACSPCVLAKDDEGRPSRELLTLFQQYLIANNVLMPWVALSYAHGDEELELTLNAVENAFAETARALSDPPLKRHLVGEPVKPVFRRFN
jgi:glutamate-1-semialdehyde 2,1-aminomutase